MAENKTAPRVTIIMPAYNAREYIEASVKSVLGQSFEDLELIVVNDGSKDDTAEILQRMAEKDSRLRPMTVENGGPALARNRGLESVKPGTEYLMFIDSDDAMEPDAVEYALRAAEKGAELVLFGFTIVAADGSRREYSEPEQFIPREALGENFARLYKANLFNQVWGKLYKAELILDNSVRFQDYRWGEDRLFIFDCLEHVNSVCVLPEPKYSYIMHTGESLITRYYDKKFQVCLEIDRRVERLCRELGVKEDADLRYMFAKSVFSCLTNLFSRSCTLSREEKRAVTENMIKNERVISRSRGASGGLPTALLCSIMRTGSVGLNLAAFRFVALSGELAPSLFMKLKHRK